MTHLGNSPQGDLIISFSREELNKIGQVFGDRDRDDFNNLQGFVRAINSLYSLTTDISGMTTALEHFNYESQKLLEVLRAKEFDVYSPHKE